MAPAWSFASLHTQLCKPALLLLHCATDALQIQPTRREGIPWGFTTSIIRDGVTLTDISVSFDEEVAYKYDWVGKAADGFPQLEGNAEEIMGKNFVIRSVHTTQLRQQFQM